MTSKNSLVFSSHHALAFTVFILAYKNKMYLSVLKRWAQLNEQKRGINSTPTDQYCAWLCNESKKSKVASVFALL